MNLDTFVSKAKSLASIASKKTSNAVEISKLNLRAVQVNTMIQSTYERIGSLYYTQSKTQSDNSSLMSICVAEIDSLLAELSEINSRIASLKTGVVCKKCGEVNPIESMYCAKCGFNLKLNNKVND